MLAIVRNAAVAAALLQPVVLGHTFIWGVFVNGVDQGTFKGIRIPAFNGPPPRGYNNSPVKDVTNIDIRCNIFGDRQATDTIKVVPGDHITLDWHHDWRNDTDDVIDGSHKGPSLIYLTPDPPTENSFVKIWESGFEEGKWSTNEIAADFGNMNMRIPEGLKAGRYLIRGEMIALHEGDADWTVNPRRGAQFYPSCVQIEVTGDGEVELPEGVSFPGAYAHDDPGVHYNVYCSNDIPVPTDCVTTYDIPGPTVWSGAFPETTAVDVGPVEVSTKGLWSSWIDTASIETSGVYNEGTLTVFGSAPYTASWSTTYQTPAPTAA